MRLHLWLPTFTAGEPEFRRLPDRARAVERSGFDGIFLLDHLLPIAGVHTSAWFDTLTALTVLATSTDYVTIGTASLVAGVRDPVVLAKQIASIAVLAGPRVVLGAGAGWYADEYRAVGRQLDDRAALTDETLRAVRALLRSDEPVSYHGDHVNFDDVRIVPRSDDAVPIWVAGGSRTPDAGSEHDRPAMADSVLRRIAEHDGWIAPCAGRFALTLDDLAAVRPRVPHGRPFTLSHVQWVHVVDTDDRGRALSEQLPRFRAMMGEHHSDEHLTSTYLLGSRPEVEARVAAIADAGFDDLIVGPVVHDPDQATLIADVLGPIARA